MTTRWSLAMVVAVVLAVPVVTAGPCTQTNGVCSLKCDGCTSGQTIANPADCQQYYYCNAETDPPSALPIDCPNNQYYDPDVGCTSGTECLFTCCNYECPTTNLKGVVLVAHQTLCSGYYTCDSTGRLPAWTQCDSSTPFFDGLQCQTDESKCCSCKAYCDQSAPPVDYYVKDPTDCTGYYFCNATISGPYFPEKVGHCPEGQIFDESIPDCVPDPENLCTPSCYNVVGQDGCIKIFTCQESGYFAKCPLGCSPSYFDCNSGNIGEVDISPYNCSSGMVFNPDTDQCVAESQCPFASL